MQATIGISTGAPRRIGREVILKSIPSVSTPARWILFTDRSVFQRNIERFAPAFKYQWIDRISDAGIEPILFVHDLRAETSDIRFGERSPRSGQRALAYLKAAGEEALRGQL